MYFAAEGGDAYSIRGFTGIDGRTLRSGARKLQVLPGHRTIEYMCQMTVDGPPLPKVTMEFKAGKSYELHCTPASAEATVVEL